MSEPSGQGARSMIEEIADERDAYCHRVAELEAAGARVVSLEQLREALPEIGPDDDALAALAAIKARVHAGDRWARRVRILEERLRSIDELIRGRRDPELLR